LPPADAALGPGDVHVWRLSLAPPAAQLEALAHTLDDAERARAARFHFERDRTAFTVARGALRTLLGRYLAQPPERIAFGYRDKGKPHLAPGAPGGPGDVQFNLSHSGQLGLVAFARGREIGVDIEQRRPLRDLLALARTSFSPAEYTAFCALPPPDQLHAFFSCWSRKEAFIKATGEGISQLADFDVSLAPGEPARLLRVAGEPPDRPRWSLHDLPAIAEYAAALVLERRAAHPDGRDAHIACWDWSA
jgi:4'-phosphopantetheinyl transferase